MWNYHGTLPPNLKSVIISAVFGVSKFLFQPCCYNVSINNRALSSTETFCARESYTWLLTTWNMTSVTKDLNILLLIKVKEFK